MLLQTLIWKQVMTFKVERGRNNLNPSNIIAVLGYAAFQVLAHYANRHFFKAVCTFRRHAVWHAAQVAVFAAFVSPFAYPLGDSMYIILVVAVRL